MYLASPSYLMACQESLWSFYTCSYKCLTLEMLFRRNLVLQRRSPMKLLLLFGFPAWLSSPGFVYLLIFLSIFKQILDICKNVNLENTLKTESFPSACACQGPYQVHATACMHTWTVAGRNQGVVGHTWSQQPLLGPSLPSL